MDQVRIKIAKIIQDSVVDGPGLRATIFFQGCLRNCPNCHNPGTHDVAGGEWMDLETIIETIKSNPYTRGVTISGGEPFLQPKELSLLLSKLKLMGYDLIVYTGYKWEELTPEMKEALQHIDFLIDGGFEEERHDLALRFKGSANQRIIDVQESLKRNGIVLINL